MFSLFDGKIKSEGRLASKCPCLQRDGRPSATALAIRPSQREGRLRAVVGGRKTLLLVVLSTGLASGLVLALCSVVRLNVSPSVPLGLYRMVDEPVARGVLVVACVPPDAARLARDRGYLTAGSCPGGTRPILKRLGAVPGDIVDLDADGVAVNGVRLPKSATAARDTHDRPLPHAPWGRTVTPPGEAWLFATETTPSWDSRYFGPVALDHVHAVRPVLTLRGGR